MARPASGRPQCLVHFEAAVLDRLGAMRRTGTFLLSRTSRPFTGSLEEPLSVQRRRRADFVDLLGPSRRGIGIRCQPWLRRRRGACYRLDGARPRRFLMSKVALAIGLAGLLLATASTTGSSAMTIVPLAKSAISGPSGDLDLVRWRNCWRDRWGRRRCNWCWRDRWGRVRCG